MLKSVVGALVMELCRGGIKRSETSCVGCVYVVELCCRLNVIVMHNMDVMHYIDYL